MSHHHQHSLSPDEVSAAVDGSKTNDVLHGVVGTVAPVVDEDDVGAVTDDPSLTAAAAAAAVAAENADAVVMAVAAAAVDVPDVMTAATTTTTTASVVVDVGDTTKWNKNAFGAPVPKQSGKFSKEESELVKKSVEEYCAAKQISTARLCSECDHKAELKGAWMEIAKRIPHRSVQSVYRHGIRRLHPFKRGGWTEGECEGLVELVARYGKKWSTIQGKLNRSADSCRDKYREMGDEFVKGRWKEHDTEMLKTLIRELVGVPADTSMKEVARIVDERGIQIPWSTISRRIHKRTRLSCFKKWQKLIGVVSDDSDYGGDGGGKRKTLDPPEHGSSKRRAKGSADNRGRHVYGTSAGVENPGDPPPGIVGEFDEAYSAKIADETVEAVGLPDARASFV